MLQKGFLKPKETEEQSRAIKKSRLFLFAGIVMALCSLIYTMSNIFERTSLFIGASMLIAGFCLITASIWLNFFTQNKGRR